MTDINTKTIRDFFDRAKAMDYRFLMAEMDKMQDAEDQKQGKHIPIVLTVAIFAELIHRADIALQRRQTE